MTEDEERQCGRALLAVFREMFDDRRLGLVYDFDTWVDEAPIPPNGRKAIALARAAAAEEGR